MEAQRKKLIRLGVLPLSFEESKVFGLTNGPFSTTENPTWLMEHRTYQWLHPCHPNPSFPQMYHLYSEPEDTPDPDVHWKSKTTYQNMFYGYNPSFDILERATKIWFAHMFLPIHQRYLTYVIPELKLEIFDDLMPEYIKN